ncbi:MAG TPA: hypothetical protein VGP25_20900 [Gemmatimonadaceae bacterium]|nr:hypothetical protein [Gemmatimonadaceae bacterium]
MIPPRLRAGLFIASIVVASGIAGAALDRAFVARGAGRPPAVGTGAGGGGGGGGRGGRPMSPEQEAKRRSEMLDHMTTDLSLTPVQRAGFDSVMQRTDSALRAVRREMQPKFQQLFETSRGEMLARLDTAQRVKFNAMRRGGPPRDFRDGERGGGKPDERRQ